MAISRYETETRTPRDSIVTKIAEVLGVSTFELYFGMSENSFRQQLNEEEEANEQELEERFLPGLTKELVNTFSRLNKSGQLKALERVEELTEIEKYLNK